MGGILDLAGLVARAFNPTTQEVEAAGSLEFEFQDSQIARAVT